jgi:hypothetical protein
MRPRSANEWRNFWRGGGEVELRAVLSEAWPPLREVSEDEGAHLATRIATLLGSRAPAAALASELGRIRAHELRVEPDAEVDRAAAVRLAGWFDSATRASA